MKNNEYSIAFIIFVITAQSRVPEWLAFWVKGEFQWFLV
jgi:hypothetical protein